MLLLYLFQIIKLAAGLYSYDFCLKNFDLAVTSVSNIGKDCLRGLHAADKLDSLPLKSCMDLHFSAWEYVSSKFMELDGANALKSAFLKKRPAVCLHFDMKALLEKLKNVTISEACFNYIPKAIYENMTISQLYEMSSYSPSFYKVFQNSLAPYTTILTGIYDHFMKHEEFNFPITYDLKKFPEFKGIVNDIHDALSLIMTDSSDMELFRCSSQIIGDALIERKSIRIFNHSVDLEGATVENLYIIVFDILTTLEQDDGNLDPMIIKSFLMQIRSSLFFTAFSNVASRRNSNIIFSLIAQFYQYVMLALPENKNLIIPHGYAGNPGHATVCEIEKLTDSRILLNYFNTGSGIEYHALIENPKNVLEVKRSHKMSFIIPEKELNLQFWNYFSRLNTMIKDDKNPWKISDIYEGLFGTIPAEYLVKEFSKKDIFITGQHAGTCVFKSLMTWMRTKFPADIDYQYFKLSLKSKALWNVVSKVPRVLEERAGVQFMIQLAEEIERDAQNVYNSSEGALLLSAHYRNASLDIGKDINKLKIDTLLEELVIMRKNSMNHHKTLRISMTDFFGMRPKIDKALKAVEELLQVDDRDRFTAFEFVSYYQDVLKLNNLFLADYSIRNVLNFSLEIALKWRTDLAEASDLSLPDRYKALQETIDLFKHVRRVPINFDNDERTLLLRLILIQIWLLFTTLNPSLQSSVSMYRPLFKEIQMHGCSKFSHIEALKKTHSWSTEKKSFDLKTSYNIDGSVENAPNYALELAKLFYRTHSVYQPCNQMDEKMIARRYFGPPLMFTECAILYFIDYPTKDYEKAFLKIIELIRFCQEDYLTDFVTTPYEMITDKQFSFKQMNGGSSKNPNCRVEIGSLYSVSPKDTSSSINDIMTIRPHDTGFKGFGVKVIKQAKILYKLDEELRHFMLIVFISRRPSLFGHLQSINTFYQALSFTSKSVAAWDLNKNLVGAWWNSLSFILKYHTALHSATHSLKSVEALQHGILFSLNLVNFCTANLEVKKDFVGRVHDFLMGYKAFYFRKAEAKGDLIHPYYLISFASYIKLDFVETVSHYLTADVELSKTKSFNRKIDMMRIMEDVTGLGYFCMFSSITVESIKEVAIKAVELSHGICADAGNFQLLSGTFPRFTIPDICHMDLLSRVFLPRKLTSVFRKENVDAINYFANLDKYLKDMKSDLRMSINDLNYEFIMTSTRRYRLSFVIKKRRYLLLHRLDSHFSPAISQFLYSVWCSAASCILKKYDVDTAKVEHIAEFYEDSVAVDDLMGRLISGESIIQDFFPIQIVIGIELGKKELYCILGYLDTSGNQLWIIIENNVLYVGKEKKYFALMDDLLSRKNIVFNLDLISLLVVTDQSGQNYAFFPMISSAQVLWYSSHGKWINGKTLKESSISGYTSQMRSFVESILVPLDEVGFRKPSSVLEKSVVSFYYLISGEYELSMHFLREIYHTAVFTDQERDKLIEISNYPDQSPSAKSVRFYAHWLIHMNFELFIAIHPGSFKASERGTQLLDFYTLGKKYYSQKSHASRTLNIFYSDFDPHQSILSSYETTELLEIFKCCKKEKRESIYTETMTDTAASQIVELEDLVTHCSYLEIPYLKDGFDIGVHVFLSSKRNSVSVEMLCDAFRYMTHLASLYTRRIIQTFCCDIDKRASKRNQYEFKFDSSFVMFYSDPPLPSEKLKFLNTLDGFEFQIFESDFINTRCRLVSNMIDRFSKDILAVEGRVSKDCSSITSYVDLNVCKGELELSRTHLRRQFVVQFMTGIHAEEMIAKFKALIQLMINEQSRVEMFILKNLGLFRGNATSPLKDFRNSPIFDQSLLKFIRNAPIYLIERYFPDMPVEQAQKCVVDYFFLHCQIARFKRIIGIHEDSRKHSNIEAFLYEKADDLIVELSHRPDKELFSFEILLFEKSLNLRLRNANIEALRNLLDCPKNSVVQRVMGGGKTLVLGALGLASAQHDEFAILISPIALLETNAGNSLSINQQCFGQRGHLIYITRCYVHNGSYQHCVQYFKTLFSIVSTCVNRKEYLLTSKESLLSLYNTHKESLRRNEIGDMTQIKEITSDLIKLFRTKAFAILDEVDSVLFPFFELNYPITDDEMIRIDLARAILSTFKILVEKQDIKNIYDASDKLTSQISFDDYLIIVGKVKEYLAEDVSYIECMKDETLDESSCKNQFERFLSSTLFDCFGGRLNVSYGATDDIHDGRALNEKIAILHARPYEGSNRPSKLSEFADVVTCLTYTILTYLKKGLTEAQVILFFMDIVKIAEADFIASSANVFKTTFADEGMNALDHTNTGKLISMFCESENILSSFSNMADEEKFEFLENNCLSKSKNKQDLIFAYIEKDILPKITKTEEEVSSNAQDLFYLLKRFIAYSGTINNENIFDDQRDQVKLDDIALGEIMSEIVRKKSKVISFPNAASLSEIYELIKNQNPLDAARIRAFIDVAAVFNETSNKDLVDESISALNLKGGLFYKTGTDNLFFFDGKQEKQVKKTAEAFVKETIKLDANERFTFYDEVHSRGVDIVQATDSLALVTVGLSTCLSDLLQGILRMRKFFGNQEIMFLITKEAEAALRKKLLKDDAQLYAIDILKVARESQEKNALMENQTIFMQKIASYLSMQIILKQKAEFYSKLAITYLFELEMMKLDFDAKYEKFMSSLHQFFIEYPECQIWIENLKKGWSEKLKSTDMGKPSMTRIVEKEAQKQKEIEQQRQLQNEMEFVDLNAKFYISSGYKSLSWKGELKKVVNKTQVVNLGRTDPELISWLALNEKNSLKSSGSLCPENVYLSSNFIQVQVSLLNNCNISFKLDVEASISARRDQFGYFIAVMKNSPSSGAYSYYYFEPEESAYWLSEWRAKDKSSGLVLLLSCNGDIVYPELQDTNVFEIRACEDSFTWNFKSISATMIKTAFALGMLELFADFSLSKDIKQLEKRNKNEQFSSEALRRVDPEVENMTILRDVTTAYSIPTDLSKDWLRHLSEAIRKENISIGEDRNGSQSSRTDNDELASGSVIDDESSSKEKDETNENDVNEKSLIVSSAKEEVEDIHRKKEEVEDIEEHFLPTNVESIGMNNEEVEVVSLPSATELPNNSFHESPEEEIIQNLNLDDSSETIVKSEINNVISTNESNSPSVSAQSSSREPPKSSNSSVVMVSLSFLVFVVMSYV